MDEDIKRQAILDAIPQANEDKKISLFGAVADFITIVNEIPTADVAPVMHGHWCKELVPFRDKLGQRHLGSYCSKCGRIFDRTKFCGGCGAKMDEEESNG